MTIVVKFNCKKSSLKRWIYKYKTFKNLTRKNETLYLIKSLNHILNLR